MHPQEQKDLLRTSIQARLERLSDVDRAAESRSLCKRLEEILPKEPGTLCAYYPIRNEVDIRPLLLELFKKQWTIFLPKFEGGMMVFRQVMDLDHLRPGQFQIPEPPDAALLLDPTILDVALIPARAYEKNGNRLGRGNGGYDIWIRKQRKQQPQTHFIGVCYEAQLVSDIPMEEHDERVDFVVTARGRAA